MTVVDHLTNVVSGIISPTQLAVVEEERAASDSERAASESEAAASEASERAASEAAWTESSAAGLIEFEPEPEPSSEPPFEMSSSHSFLGSEPAEEVNIDTIIGGDIPAESLAAF